MSSLGASAQAPSQYLRSKAAGEAALLALSNKLNVTIFRPSIIFGRCDSFINLFAKLIRLLPVLVLVKPEAKFQPVWVEDVATCFVESLENKDTFSQIYELAGPKVYTFRELVNTIMSMINIKRPIIGLGDRLSYAQAFIMEWLPGQLMSRDNVRSMEVPSVSSQPFPAIFHVSPTALEAVAPEYLVNRTPRGAYDRFGSAAARH
jgi:NADH dehydrogenase